MVGLAIVGLTVAGLGVVGLTVAGLAVVGLTVEAHSVRRKNFQEYIYYK